MVELHLVHEYGLSSTLVLDATIEVEPSSLSGVYLTVDHDEHTDRSTMRDTVGGWAGPVVVQRHYSLPEGSSPQVELKATAGATSAPVLVVVAGPDGIEQSATGDTGTAILLTLPPV
jgi:hypothetical protein